MNNWSTYKQVPAHPVYWCSAVEGKVFNELSMRMVPVIDNKVKLASFMCVGEFEIEQVIAATFNGASLYGFVHDPYKNQPIPCKVSSEGEVVKAKLPITEKSSPKKRKSGVSPELEHAQRMLEKAKQNTRPVKAKKYKKNFQWNLQNVID